MLAQIWKLRPKVQHYAWGQQGKNSAVYRFARQNGLSIPDNPELPFAELWYGAHPSAPAVHADSGSALDEMIAQEAHRLLGPEAERFGNRLPYLAKVLSVRTPLSIQLHPNRSQAMQLRARAPEAYPDDNHKPEVAFALGPVELLYGFRTLAEIRLFVQEVPELASILGSALESPTLQTGSDDEVSTLSHLYARLLHYPINDVQTAAEKMVQRLASKATLTNTERAVLNAAKFFPTDSGLFSYYFLNYVRVEPGAVIFTPAGVPHAYISGELFECMSASDNVIRVGLTNKFKDRDALLECVDFRPTTPMFLQPIPVLPDGFRYTPPLSKFGPVNEFEIIVHRSARQKYLLPRSQSPGPEILVVLAGTARISADAARSSSAQDPREAVNVECGPGEACFICPSSEQISVEPLGAEALIIQVRVPG